MRIRGIATRPSMSALKWAHVSSLPGPKQAMRHSLSPFRDASRSIAHAPGAHPLRPFYTNGARAFASLARLAMPTRERSQWEMQASAASNVLERIRQLPKRRNWGHDSKTSHYDQKSNSRPSISLSTQHAALVPQTIIAHKAAMKKSFPNGWNPPKKLSREAMEGLRTLRDHDPETFTTAILANRFKISPEAVRRILKSRWRPNAKRLVQMTQKKAPGGQATITRQKFGAENTEANEDIPAMYLDEESDKLLFTDLHPLDIADPTNSDDSKMFSSRLHTRSFTPKRDYTPRRT